MSYVFAFRKNDQLVRARYESDVDRRSLNINLPGMYAYISTP